MQNKDAAKGPVPLNPTTAAIIRVNGCFRSLGSVASDRQAGGCPVRS